jgi:hypothetical protein
MDRAVRPTPVDLAADAQNGLYLCPCDISPGNFKKFEDGEVVALDFHASCFSPPVFFLFRCRGREACALPRSEGGPVRPISVIE